jgi:hypothetical protein
MQLPSIFGGLLHLHPEDVPCCGDKGPTKPGFTFLPILFFLFSSFVTPFYKKIVNLPYLLWMIYIYSSCVIICLPLISEYTAFD